MKICFVSNYLNHHQLPFSLEMLKLLEGNYKFVATTAMSPARISMYTDMNKLYPFVIRAYESEAEMEKAKWLIDNSDVVIIGSAPDNLIINRLKNNKITFNYSERLYKEGLTIRRFPRALVSAWLHHGRFQKYPLYMLCASAYTARDLSIFHNYKDRTFKWGYFPELKEYDVDELLEKKRSDRIKILWAGRFIKWKHPELAIAAAKRLSKENIPFHLKMIGDGEELEKTRDMAENMGLKSSVEFLGAIKAEKVRSYMEEANIYLFTSDFNEGWGAVLNEAMNSGCAVAASHAAGAVPFLIAQGENGVIYNNGDAEDLCNKAVNLAKDINLCERLGRNAYFTIKDTWNAKSAAERFIKLAEGIVEEKQYLYEEGPCSKAPIIKNSWFQK